MHCYKPTREARRVYLEKNFPVQTKYANHSSHSSSEALVFLICAMTSPPPNPSSPHNHHVEKYAAA